MKTFFVRQPLLACAAILAFSCLGRAELDTGVAMSEIPAGSVMTVPAEARFSTVVRLHQQVVRRKNGVATRTFEDRAHVDVYTAHPQCWLETKSRPGDHRKWAVSQVFAGRSAKRKVTLTAKRKEKWCQTPPPIFGVVDSDLEPAPKPYQCEDHPATVRTYVTQITLVPTDGAETNDRDARMIVYCITPDPDDVPTLDVLQADLGVTFSDGNPAGAVSGDDGSEDGGDAPATADVGV